MKVSVLASGSICGALVALASGCVQSHRATRPAVYVTPRPTTTVVTTPATVVAPAPTVLPPTSDREAVRVYPSTPSVTVAPPTAPPPGVATADVALADSVSQLLKSNTSMADATRNVEATVESGIVTLRGSVPTHHDRDELVLRISRLPGVVRVRDQLGVETR